MSENKTTEEMTFLEFAIWRGDQMQDMIAELARYLGQGEFADEIINWNNREVSPIAKRLICAQEKTDD